jgi:hypothetical protein
MWALSLLTPASFDLKLLLQGQLAELVKGETDKNADRLVNMREVGKGEVSFGFTALGFPQDQAVPNEPSSATRPNRTDLLGRVVANGENEIERQCVVRRTLPDFERI